MCASGRGKTASQVVSSNCDYNVKFSLKSAEKLTKSSSLRKTKTVNWCYDMYLHMKEKHDDYSPDEWKISEEELKLLKTDFYELTSLLRHFLKQFLCLYFEILYKLCSYFLTFFLHF